MDWLLVTVGISATALLLIPYFIYSGLYQRLSSFL
jgi:hypothetical protein